MMQLSAATDDYNDYTPTGYLCTDNYVTMQLGTAVEDYMDYTSTWNICALLIMRQCN